MNIPQPIESSVFPLFRESRLEQAINRIQPASPEIRSDLGWGGPPVKKSKCSIKKMKLSTSKIVQKKETQGKKKWKKPKGKPNRPLSAYNFFFRKQRATMLGDDIPSPTMELLKKRVHCKTHGKIGFAEMAREIGRRWKSLDPESKKEFDDMAKEERQRYDIELAKWKGSLRTKEDTSALDALSNAALSVSDSESTHSGEKSDDSTLEDANTIGARSDLASQNKTKQVPSHQSEQLGLTYMHSPVRAPVAPASTYYECIAPTGTTIQTSRFPMFHQDRLLLQQMMMNQAQEQMLSGRIPSTTNELAFLAQTQYRRQQMIAALFQR